jgi:hypothetical protein
MIIKQCQFQGMKDGEVFCQPILFSRGMRKTASVLEMRSKLHPKIQDFVSAIRPSAAGVYVLVNALGAGEYWGSNVNGDLFPEKGLINAPADWENLLVYPQRAREVGVAWPYGYPTFMGAYPYKHHVNKDPSRAFGRVELATWNPHMHRVELVVYLDRALCMQFDAIDVIQRIENGEFPDVSMGCKVPYDVCTICEQKSKTTNDYCAHAATMMNKILPDGRKVAVRNDFPKFFDISFVFIGADKTAKVMAKLAQKGNQVCMGDFCTIPRGSAEVAAFTKTADPFDENPSNFGYTKERARAEMENERGSLGLPKEPLHAWRWRKSEDYIRRGPAEDTKQVDQEPTVAKYASADPARDAALSQWRRQKLGEMYGVKVENNQFTDLLKVANDPIKKKINVGGVPIWIEWKKGETRLYKKGGVVKYERLMKADYGYIPGTMDSDGEELDVYVGPDRTSKRAYVIKQLKKNGSHDENKVMIAFSSKQDAKDCYLYHMGGTKEHFGGMQDIPLSSLVALFGANKGHKEKTACSCHGIGDDCGGSIEKLGALLFPISKSASHAKLSEIIKSIPAGPFSKETLPKLEGAERNIPNSILDLMGDMPLGNALSTPTMAGMVLKPREFQRVMLIQIGERPLADEMDSKGMTFGRSNDVDESIPLDEGMVDSGLMGLLSRLGLVKDRSAASPALHRRSMAATTADKPFHSIGGENISSEPVMKKLAAVYNGYRRSVLRKAASISHYMTTDSQLRADLFGSSMAQAFAGGVEKVSFASVLSPDSLAYLVGAYTDRDMLLTDEVVASLALTGAVAEAA